MTLKEQVDFIHRYMPGTLEEISMMVPCHINTLRKIKTGDDNVRPSIRQRIGKLYEKAQKIRDIAEA